MELQEFREQFIKELREEADVYQTDVEKQFIRKVTDELIDLEVFEDPQIHPIELRDRKRRIMAFDLYGYDGADEAYYLAISDFKNISETTNLTNTQIEAYFNRMRLILEESINGKISDYCDESDDVIEIAKQCRKLFRNENVDELGIKRFKFFIFSNQTLSAQVKNFRIDDVLGLPASLDVWSLERFYENYINSSSEIIEFNTQQFGVEGIPVLKADLGSNAAYDAYLGILPGKLLADLYIQYGSKLLQGNIRAFLSARGKVNKGIRKTISNEPYNFFTYNNGIAIVARSIELSDDGKMIVSFKDPQIINGGQTTASLANAIIKKEMQDNEHGMDNLFVPMKLTVLNVGDTMEEAEEQQYNRMKKTISQCANSQNAVSDADFFSNHPFHVTMEELSNKLLAPAVNGGRYMTHWYYERSRGKWEQQQMLKTPREQEIFKLQYPKNQVIKKEKLAKCLNTIYMNPHQVCQSSAINFTFFAKKIQDEYEKTKENFNEEFYKKAVCAVLIFDRLDALISKSSWYPQGGNKAQITPYTIAKLMKSLPTDKTINWKRIWDNQNLYTELSNELLSIAYKTHLFLNKEANGGLVRSISRKESVWNNYKNIPISLSDSFIASLVPITLLKENEDSERRNQKFNLGIDASVEVFNKGVNFWIQRAEEIYSKHYISYGDYDFIKSIASYINKNNLPTPAQCKRLVRIINTAEEKGYIMPQ